MVFIRKKQKSAEVGHNIFELLGGRVKAQKGAYGIELECEGRRLSIIDPETGVIEKYWTQHQDGSLRAKPEALEFVLKTPLPYEEARNSLTFLFDKFAQNKTVLNESNRTSLHVHVNVQKWYSNRIAAFSTLFFIFEEYLSHFCGEYRAGNLFCLRAIDANKCVDNFVKLVKTGATGQFTDNDHYFGFNGNAIRKFGSIEIRHMRGIIEVQTGLDWLEIIEAFANASSDFKEDPSKICFEFSQQGPLEFFRRVLNNDELVAKINAKVQWSEEQLRESTYNGLRLAQEITYARNWDTFKQAAPDPFQRAPQIPVENLGDAGGRIRMAPRALNELFVNPNPAPNRNIEMNEELIHLDVAVQAVRAGGNNVN